MYTNPPYVIIKVKNHYCLMSVGFCKEVLGIATLLKMNETSVKVFFIFSLELQGAKKLC